MLALEIEKVSVKGFMGRLLRENIFDMYEVRSLEMAITTKMTVDGVRIPENETEQSQETKRNSFISWGELRPLMYEIIKLSAKPKYMKVVFSFANPHEIHINAAALFLNLIYENDSVTFTTATAQKEFVLDKSLDLVWDEWVRNFLNSFNVRDRDDII